MRPSQREFIIREARPEEFEKLGQLMVAVYSSLEGFPDRNEQPRYYDLLANIGVLADRPDTQLWVAVAANNVIGGVVYVSDMTRYGARGIEIEEKHTSGFRLLAVDPEARGLGVGKALAMKCIELARDRNHRQLIIHSTHAMKVAWGMYERLGFKRSPDLDFLQEELPVFGFRLLL